MNGTLLIRYLKHDCNPSEMNEIERWVAADGAHAEWLFEMERLWALKNEQRFSEPGRVDEMFDRLWTRLQQTETAARPAPKTVAWRSVLKYAAAVAIVTLLSANLYHLLKGAQEDYAENIVEVPAGQRIVLTLPDATRVWLNSQTTLSYPARFANGSRTVKLSGEAFFEVSRSGSKPFIVESPLMCVKVLGTKFDVKTYPDENASVTLTEGKVEVSADHGKYRLALVPNQQAVYSKTSGLTLQKHINPDMARSWIIGELNFYDRTLAAIAADLERWFDVQIHIDSDALANDKFTCHFKENVTLEEVLANLKETKRLNYAVHGREIRITK
ncbi:MAG: DUF4974 domain-containing protein [Tannerella sp.]|nr:DUF4974 domain-containing protein [Tannerella sp.]